MGHHDAPFSGGPIMSNGYRTLSQHLNDLKKENFSLKLRIYFLEERIQQKYEESGEDVHKRNIELKVEVESLKQELQDKQCHLDKALTTAESVSSHNEAELQRRCEEQQQEIDHMQEILESKIQLLQEEAKLARNEAAKMATLVDSRSLCSLPADASSKESPEERTQMSPGVTGNGDRTVEDLTQALRDKEARVAELADEGTLLRRKTSELESRVRELMAALQKKEQDAEGEIDEDELCTQQEYRRVGSGS
ncbi:hypothetical protein Z043_110850 [Scleropages formosus]|uniref:Centrosomin N-terminal motif 1 domain-containing protein n=1 Tax=Scleropages formosus TaxID=113540 RepID=A0A0P7UJY7_SCLFO|nr:hypothetical protein Z043_110850 [Scleropages formosus]